MSKLLRVLFICGVALICPGFLAHGAYVVNAADSVDSTGILATSRQLFNISATGSVNISDQNGGYTTSPDGVILVAPPVGSGAYDFFLDNAAPIGVAPVDGIAKNILSSYANDDLGELVGAPFAGLLAGFSSTANPSSPSDFTGGLVFVGSSSTIIAPTTGGYLFLAVNDINRGDNDSSFIVSVSAVPEPASLLMMGSGILGMLFYTRFCSGPNASPASPNRV